MPNRVIFNHTLFDVPVPRVKLWRLKRMAGNNDECTAARPSMVFCCPEQRPAPTGTSERHVHPKMRHVATTTPRVTIDTRLNCSSVIAMNRVKRMTVEVASRFRVVFVDALDQERFEIAIIANVNRNCFLRHVLLRGTVRLFQLGGVLAAMDVTSRRSNSHLPRKSCALDVFDS
jgi:hypothetical protein